MPRTNLAVAGASATSNNREFTFSDEDFRSIAEIAYEKTGIVLSEAKRNLVYGRLSRRLRQIGLETFGDYRKRLADDESESEPFINAISTNLTKFFREAHHFDHLRSQLAEPFARSGSGRKKRLRIWSAGCSTGEEAYSIAMVLQHAMRSSQAYDAKILATDIDTEVIARGAAGEYPADSFADVPRTYREAFGLHDDVNEPVTMAESLRGLISFGRLNLLQPWPMRGPFDAIFCRNVMIYFDAPTKSALVRRFIEILKPGGWLYIGHSESLLGSYPGLKLIGRTIYRRDP